MKGVQAVYHAGGAMGGNWDAHRRITVEGTQNVVDAALAEGVERVVHFSSLVVYHLLTARRGTLIDEAFPHDETHRLGPYSRGKVEAEKIVVAARDRGLPITIVRPGMVIGPRGRVFFPHMGYRLRDRMFVVLGPGRVRLPLVYIDNLVAGVIQAMHSESAVGKAYNLVDDGQVTVNEYLSRFATSTEPPAKIVHLPYFMAYSATGMYEFCAALGIVAKGVTSRAQLAWKHKSVGYSNASAKQDFGFESLVPIADALDRTFRWYLASRAEIPARDPASGASRLDARPIPAG
jgi:nucleoside-diphosphate-sugar epimerase